MKVLLSFDEIIYLVFDYYSMMISYENKTVYSPKQDFDSWERTNLPVNQCLYLYLFIFKAIKAIQSFVLPVFLIFK